MLFVNANMLCHATDTRRIDVNDKVCINQLFMEIIWLVFLAETLASCTVCFVCSQHIVIARCVTIKMILQTWRIQRKREMSEYREHNANNNWRAYSYDDIIGDSGLILRRKNKV